MKKELHVTLDPSMALELRWWSRRPRSKKRRIQNKWRTRKENWSSRPNIVQTTIMFGPEWAGKVPEPNKMPTMISLHPDLWEKIKDRRELQHAKVTLALPIDPEYYMLQFSNGNEK